MRLHALHALHTDRRRSLLLAHVLGLAAWTGPLRAALASLVDDDVATAVFEAVSARLGPALSPYLTQPPQLLLPAAGGHQTLL